MPPRLPTPSDLPPFIHLTITPPPPASPQPTNILLLLHGLGDTSAPFTTLSQHLALPSTTCISLRAPTPLPFSLGGFHWGDDIQFDQSTGNMDFDTGFTKAITMIKEDVVEKVLVEKCGYKLREIMFWGYGQGGMVAIAAAAAMAMATEEELGGIIDIGGTVPVSCKHNAKGIMTPILVLGGSSNTLITRTAITDLKASFRNVEYHKWSKAGDGMPKNREEMLPIMRFFARRLRSWRGVPEGSVEIG